MSGYPLHPRHPASNQAGFILVEAVVALALMALCAGSVFAAVVAVQHQTVAAEPTAALVLSAQNVLTDLRAATVYDASELGRLTGHSTTFDVTQASPDGSPQTLHVVAGVAQSAPGGGSIATVTITNGRGQSVTVQSPLVTEAPAPGSVLTADSLAPDGAPRAGALPAPSPSAPASVRCRPEPQACRSPSGPIAL